MDAPPIRYAHNPAGQAIAYSSVGQGIPLIYCEAVNSHVARSWEIPERARWFGELAKRLQLVCFDPRNTGSSDRDGTERLTTPAIIDDALAALDELGADKAIFFGHGGALASPLVTLAARQPERVAALIVWNGGLQLALARALLPVLELSLELYLETGLLWRGWDEKESRQALRRLRLDSASAKLRRSFLDEADERALEAAGLVESANIPTLILDRHPVLSPVRPRDDESALGHDAVNEILAKRLRSARRLVLPGWEGDPELGDTESVLRAIDSFLDELSGGPPDNRNSSHQSFRAILFTDIVASTPLLAQLKDAKMREVMRDHDEVLTAAVTGHGGRVVKTIGDAFMAEFAVPSAAVEAAIEAQRAIRERFADADVPVRLRIGINAGEPIEEGGDLHGTSVVIAKRLESAADVNGILVSDVVKQMVAGKEFDFEDRGLLALKGFDEPVRAWAVRWEGARGETA